MERVVYLSWEDSRNLVLERLRDWVATLPPAERGLKLVWDRYLLSPNDMIYHVESFTEIGKKIIVAELEKIAQVVGVSYVIRE